MSFDFRLAEPRARAAALFKALLPGRRTRRPPAPREQHERRAEAQPGRREGAGARADNLFDTDFLRKLERLHLVAKRLSWAGAAGEHPASRKGFSLEFSDYRRYQAGDDLRYVDWNIYRRLERLLLKVFTSEEELNIYVLIDASRSMAAGVPAKLDHAKKIAAALGYIGLKNLDRVGGASFSTRLHAPLALGRGRKHILKMFRFLSELSCGGLTDLRAAAHAFTRLFPHPGFVIVLSDLYDPAGWRAALEELSAKRHQLLVIHIIDDQESGPEPRGDVALVDVESGRERKIFLSAELVRRYRSEFAAYCAELETMCSSRRIEYLRTTTAMPFEEFVLQTLRRVSSVA
jgi:uncharacterized protein (DUF58 family)